MPSGRPGTTQASRVALEPLALRHRAPMQRLVSDPQVCGPLGYPCPFPSTEAAEIVSRYIDGRKVGRVFAFAIMAEGVFVGACTLRKREVAADDAELGFWIGRDFWGHGHATRALLTLLDGPRSARAITTVTARCLASNHAAHRVLGKLGFTHCAADEPDPAIRSFRLTRSPLQARRGPHG